MINAKGDNSFNYKTQKLKIKYEFRTDNKIFLSCDAGYGKVM